jgi:hypothetical protein
VRETRAVANFQNRRSDGIEDLRFGALIHDEGREADPDEFLWDRCGEVRFLPHAAYHFVAPSAAPAAVGSLRRPPGVSPQRVRPRPGGYRP